MTCNIDSRAIANAILQESWDRNLSITHLKLQKLLFLCHSFYLVKVRKGPLIRGNFEAWQYGPVHREAYEAFKVYGEKPITQLCVSTNPITGMKTSIPIPTDQAVRDNVSDVVRFYGNWESGDLVELTHAKDGPWDFIIKSASDEANMGLRISDEIIVERFKYHWFGAKNRLEGVPPNEEKQIIA